MKIGVRAHDFSRMSEIELPKIIKNAGFDATQLALTKAITGINKFSDIDDRLLERIRIEFDKNELEISVYGCYIEPSILDKEKRLENVNIFKKSIENAKKLGVKIVGTETTDFPAFNNEQNRESSYLTLLDSVLRMVETAEKENINIGIEPVALHTLNTPELTKRLIEDVKSSYLKVIFDPVNLILPETAKNQDQIFKNCFELFGNEIEVVHIKDIIIQANEKQWCNIGRGILNYGMIFDWLKKNKPNVSVLREGVNMNSYKEDLYAIENLVNKN